MEEFLWSVVKFEIWLPKGSPVCFSLADGSLLVCM